MDEILNLPGSPFLDSMFPAQHHFPILPQSAENPWKEEWKTRTVEEVQAYFFPEVAPRKKNGIVLCDALGVLSTVAIEDEIQLAEVKIDDYGHPRDILTLDNMTIWFFASSDGARLLRAYRNLRDSKSKSPDVLAVFIETDDSSNIFGSVMNFVVGYHIKKAYKDDEYWAKILDFMDENEIQVSTQDTRKLFDKALNGPGLFYYISFLFNKIKTSVNHAFFSALAYDFSLIAKGFSVWKYEDKYWNPENPEFSYKDAPFIFTDKQKTPNRHYEKMRLKSCTEIIEKTDKLVALLNASKKELPKAFTAPAAVFLKMVSDEVNRFYDLFKTQSKDLIALLSKGPEYSNSFLCGFINGFLDFVAGIFSLLDFLLQFLEKRTDYALNKGYYQSLCIEYMENAIEALSKFSVVDFFKQLIVIQVESMVKLVDFCKNLGISNTSLCKIAYFSGYVLFGIVQIVLEILFTGGSATLERMFAKGTQAVEGFVKKAANFTDDVFAALGRLIKLIKSGAENFAQFIRKITDDVFKWLEDLFMSGKVDEVFEGIIKLSDEAEVLLKKYADNAVLVYTKLQRPSVVSVLEGNGKRIFAYSNKSKIASDDIPKGLHPLVEKWLTKEADKSLILRPTHGKCAEPTAISKWLWEIDPKGKMKIEKARKEFEGVVSKAVKIEGKKTKSIEHAKLKEACDSCNPLLKYFNIKEVH